MIGFVITMHDQLKPNFSWPIDTKILLFRQRRKLHVYVTSEIIYNYLRFLDIQRKKLLYDKGVSKIKLAIIIADC